MPPAPCVAHGAMLVAAVPSVLLLARARAGRDVRVYLTRGEQLAYVQREADTPAEALRPLPAGPTRPSAPRATGRRSRRGVTLTSARERGDTSRLALSATLDEAARAQDVRSHYGDEPPTRGPARAAGRYTARTCAPGEYTEPKPPTKRPAPADPRAVQTKLAALGYLPASAVTGKWDYRTQQAVLAFQGWRASSATGSSGR